MSLPASRARTPVADLDRQTPISEPRLSGREGRRTTRGLPWGLTLAGSALFALLLVAPLPAFGAVTATHVGSAIYHPGNWTLLNATGPSSRQSGAMAYDPLVHKFVLFGGYSGGPLGDTWVFSGAKWTDLTHRLHHAPSARWYYSMTWDPVDHYVLLFGGRNSNSDLNDTWAFNGTAWSLIKTASAPPPITSGRMVFDARDGYVVLFGGYSIMPTGPGMFNFTWTYLGGVWTNITSKVVGAPPDPHVTTYAAYDPGTGAEVFYGGSRAPSNASSGCSMPGYTWLYRGGTYLNISSRLRAAPPVSFGSRMMAYDPGFPGVVLYGGWDGGSCAFSNETWVFHNGVWTQHMISSNPGSLWDAAIAANPSSHTVLMFGGNLYPYTTYQSSSTWELTP